MGVSKLQQELDLSVRWVPFPLHPDTPPGGRSLEALFAGTGMDLPSMLRRLRATAASLGLPFGDRTCTYNSRLAQELGEWAEERGAGDAFRTAAYRAYFADGANLAEHAVLLELAAEAGLPADGAREVLETRSHAPAVDAHWRRAAALGVRAVPTHRVGDAGAAGFLPYPELRRFLATQGAGAMVPEETP